MYKSHKRYVEELSAELDLWKALCYLPKVYNAEKRQRTLQSHLHESKLQAQNTGADVRARVLLLDVRQNDAAILALDRGCGSTARTSAWQLWRPAGGV